MTVDEEAVEAQLERFIARFTPEIAARVRACRAAVRERLPGATELVYDNYNALAIGYAANAKLTSTVFSIAVYPRNVALYFMYGASLPDPQRLLRGEGTRGRHLRLAGPETFDAPGVAELIEAAVARTEPPVPEQGPAPTIIKSISARQRPRRPKEAA